MVELILSIQRYKTIVTKVNTKIGMKKIQELPTILMIKNK